MGAASARLFAAGLDARERLAALRFLGVLLRQADESGRIHGDPDDIIGLGLLHGLPPDEVEYSRRSLESIGALEREATGWFIRDFQPVGDEVPPDEAMDVIARVLRRPLNREPAITPVPTPSPSRFPARWVAAPVGVGIAAAVLVVALVLSGQMQLRLPGQAVSNSRENAQQVTTGSTTTVPEELGTAAPSGATSTPGAPSSSAPSGKGATGTSAPAGASSAPTVACPVGGVVAVVEDVSQHVDSSVPASAVRASLPPLVRTTVSGVVRNTSTSAAVVSPFPVDVTFSDPAAGVSETVTATALATQTTVAPGPGLPWSVVVDTPPRAPVPQGATANASAWRWQDPVLAVACPH